MTTATAHPLKMYTLPAGTGDAYRTGGRDSKDQYAFEPYRRVLLDSFPQGSEDDHLLDAADDILPEDLVISHVPDAILAAVELIVSVPPTADLIEPS